MTRDAIVAGLAILLIPAILAFIFRDIGVLTVFLAVALLDLVVVAVVRAFRGSASPPSDN
jgi:hypothetical protein